MSLYGRGLGNFCTDRRQGRQAGGTLKCMRGCWYRAGGRDGAGESPRAGVSHATKTGGPWRGRGRLCISGGSFEAGGSHGAGRSPGASGSPRV